MMKDPGERAEEARLQKALSELKIQFRSNDDYIGPQDMKRGTVQRVR